MPPRFRRANRISGRDLAPPQQAGSRPAPQPQQGGHGPTGSATTVVRAPVPQPRQEMVRPAQQQPFARPVPQPQPRFRPVPNTTVRALYATAAAGDRASGASVAANVPPDAATIRVTTAYARSRAFRYKWTPAVVRWAGKRITRRQRAARGQRWTNLLLCCMALVMTARHGPSRSTRRNHDSFESAGGDQRPNRRGAADIRDPGTGSGRTRQCDSLERSEAYPLDARPRERQVIHSGGPVQDAAGRKRFLEAYQTSVRPSGDARVTLLIGSEGVPVSIPAGENGERLEVRLEGRSREVLNRQIGRSERSPDPEYASLTWTRNANTRPGSRQGWLAGVYAQKVISTP